MTAREDHLEDTLQELYDFTLMIVDQYVNPETLVPLWETMNQEHWQKLDSTVSSLLHGEGSYE
jgi:hypothetical protein